jgi:hypothetical protein
MEAILEVADGKDLDEVLEAYGRIPAGIYHAVGASHFPKPFIISGTSS